MTLLYLFSYREGGVFSDVQLEVNRMATTQRVSFADLIRQLATLAVAVLKKYA
jgi:hypothetical protein